MRTLNPSEEQLLLNSVKTAVDLVDNQQMSPDDALTKVARDNKLTPGFVKAAVSAYNNGRQVAQFQANQDILDKLAEFPLADYDIVYNNVWGGTTKQAMDHYHVPSKISAEYSLPPVFKPDETMEKLAHLDLTPLLGQVELPPHEQEHQAMLDKHASDKAMRQAYNAHRDALREFEDQRSKYANARDVVSTRVKLLENYFKKFAMDRLSFPIVDDAVQTYYGAQGRALMDLVASKFPNEKRAADTRVFCDKPVNRDLPPFSYVKSCIEGAKQVHRCKQAMDEAEGALKTATENLRPFGQSPQQQNSDPFSVSLIDDTEKRAFWGLAGASAIGASTKSLVDKALGPEGRKADVEKAWLDLEDPEHENELRRIRAEAMLSNMMADEENPISGYDPETVLQAYNEIAQMAPRAAEQPAAIQPLLAKRLAGSMEPFEVKEIADLEKGLKDAKQPTPQTQILSDAPQSILG